MTANASTPAPLSGTTLILAGVVLAVTNFMVVLDTTIANVSVAHMRSPIPTRCSGWRCSMPAFPA
ncbi:MULTISPECIES: hypothetical protein [Sphingobium]|uniref:Uncharacterized protein n=1 Tax=Sphingobium fuliginis (strain ATCC 27551) TaxID=336203 RepID=A0ABQ1EXV0_SPHSA|nr:MULTISPECIES: hypothetical protein [Sphingobium]RYL98171.1 hypothetical protein EWH10_12110 [Sphingobium fuliginis]WDA39214.1 hypothetical protein PO876_15555 [Sphingobium sp. YC-XJ3]GFZ91404.1 hypothetical protein GCM10019071_21900 [Sphingobium fuliginis]